MGAGTINVSGYQLIDWLKLQLGQVGGDFLSDNQYNDAISAHVGDETTYTLKKRRTGIYTYSLDEVLYLIYGAAPFSAEADITYRVNAVGPVVTVTTGTATATSITFTGCAVDADAVLLDLLQVLKVRASKDRRISLGTGEVSEDGTFLRINRMMQDIRGAQALG